MAIQLRCLYQSDDDLTRLRTMAESLGLKEYQQDDLWHGYYRHIEFYDNVTVGQVFKEKRRILSEIKRQQNMEPIANANGDMIPTAIKRNQA